MKADDLIEIYAENLKRLRQARGMSQEVIAERAEISAGYLSEIENKKKTGTFETVAALADALEVEPFELFLPLSSPISPDAQRIRQLMKTLRGNVIEVMNTIEKFLSE